MLIPPVPDYSHAWTVAGGFNYFYLNGKKTNNKKKIDLYKHPANEYHATVNTNMVVFVRLLGHNQTEEKTGAYAAQKVDNMSAAWKPLGGERKIKKGIQPWHTCSDTSAFQREKKTALWSEKHTIIWLHRGQCWGCRGCLWRIWCLIALVPTLLS